MNSKLSVRKIEKHEIQILDYDVQISDEYFKRLFLQFSVHSVINEIQIRQIWRPQLRWNKFWSFFL